MEANSKTSSWALTSLTHTFHPPIWSSIPPLTFQAMLSISTDLTVSSSTTTVLISKFLPPGTEITSDSPLSATSGTFRSTSSLPWALAAPLAKATLFFLMENVLPIAQPDPTTTEKLALPVLSPKPGMVQSVLTDVIQAEFGASPHRLVSAQLVNSGMDSLASSAPMEEPGTLTPSPANVQSPQPGTELLVSLALEAESTTTSPINVNAPAAKPSTVSSAPSTVQLVNFTMKPSKDAPAPEVKTGMATFVSSVSVDKLGTPP